MSKKGRHARKAYRQERFDLAALRKFIESGSQPGRYTEEYMRRNGTPDPDDDQPPPEPEDKDWPPKPPPDEPA